MPRIDVACLVVLFAAFGASGEASCGAGIFRVDPAHTTARFSVPQLGFSKPEGRLGRTSGTIVLDAQQKVESIDLEIDTASVDTGWSLRDAFLRSEVMFDVGHYPRMRFRSTRLVYDGERLAGVEGEVTLRDVTRPVRFDVLHLECRTRPDDGREACGAEVSGRISRSAFGMDFAYPLIGDDVDLEFVVNAFRVREVDEGKRDEVKRP
jgi:polyisoprenoid-binding protein YceI